MLSSRWVGSYYCCPKCQIYSLKRYLDEHTYGSCVILLLTLRNSYPFPTAGIHILFALNIVEEAASWLESIIAGEFAFKIVATRDVSMRDIDIYHSATLVAVVLIRILWKIQCKIWYIMTRFFFFSSIDVHKSTYMAGGGGYVWNNRRGIKLCSVISIQEVQYSCFVLFSFFFHLPKIKSYSLARNLVLACRSLFKCSTCQSTPPLPCTSAF